MLRARGTPRRKVLLGSRCEKEKETKVKKTAEDEEAQMNKKKRRIEVQRALRIEVQNRG